MEVTLLLANYKINSEGTIQMLFNSMQFLIFFPLVVLGYIIIPPKLRYIYLLFVSYIFYMGWNPKYALLIAISTIITYFCGIFLNKASSLNIKKAIIAIGFSSNIAILFFFKYFNFFMDSIDSILDFFNISVSPPPFDVILPVGISFYTFQALGYIVDVYRENTKAEKNFLKYALFVSFFPSLITGPIERSENLLGQINKLHDMKIPRYIDVTSGLITMVWGLFVKMVIADRIAILVDTVFDTYWVYGFFGLSVATVGFAIQIYCDFSSYSTIAIGAAQVMGFSLMENFNTPYFARSIKEFWQRWHISLSTWFKDYLYIPLGGNRISKCRTYLNMFIVFLVSGIWHGANWTFIFWGALHGMYQIIGSLLIPTKKHINNILKTKTNCFSYKFGQITITFFLVSFAWIFFRSDTIVDAFQFINRMFTNRDFWAFFDGSIYTLGLLRPEFNILLISLVALFLVDLIKYAKGLTIDKYLEEQNIWFQWAIIISIFISTIVFGIYGPAFDAKQFIYFQF